MSENIREAVANAVVLHLSTRPGAFVFDLYNRVLKEMEIPLLRQTLRHHKGNQSLAAATLGLNRATLRQKLRRHRISARDYR